MADSDLFLFVSHVGEDRPAAMEIVAELERRGIHCWVTPRDVRGGRPYDDEIADAIDASRAMLLIFSEHCNNNQYIRRELTVAGESQKIIIPFRIEDAYPKRGLRVRLSDLHWIDGFVARERALDELLRALPPPDDEAERLRREEEQRRLETRQEDKRRQTAQAAERQRQEELRRAQEEERCRLEEAAERQRQDDERRQAAERQRQEEQRRTQEDERRQLEEARAGIAELTERRRRDEEKHRTEELPKQCGIEKQRPAAKGEREELKMGWSRRNTVQLVTVLTISASIYISMIMEFGQGADRTNPVAIVGSTVAFLFFVGFFGMCIIAARAGRSQKRTSQINGKH